MVKESCRKSHTLMSYMGSVAGGDNVFLLMAQERFLTLLLQW